MKRATYLQFANPRENTPDCGKPVVTNTGSKLLAADRDKSKSVMGKESRFVDIEQHIRLLKCVPGPGHYVPRTQLLDRVSNSPCKIIQKPFLNNENH